MTSTFSIARYTLTQQLRNRLYLVIILFGVLMVGASVLFGAVAADQEIRVILDLGFATTEFFGLAMALFGAVTLVLEEMESKTIYLILTRPQPRATYILGRFLGLVLAVWTGMALMEVMHFALLFFKGWKADPLTFAALPAMGLKVMIMTALALLCSLLFTSAPTATVFSLFFWVLGHFGEEIRFLAKKSGQPVAMALVKGLLWILPNLTMLNLRDHLEIPGFPLTQILPAALYALLYTGAALSLSIALFARKEF